MGHMLPIMDNEQNLKTAGHLSFDRLRHLAGVKLLPLDHSFANETGVTPNDQNPGENRTGMWGPSDFDLNPGLRDEVGAVPPPVPAAVLIGITEGTKVTVLLCERTTTLSAHAGQIAFPGGKLDPGDRDFTETAVREAHEEIGLHQKFVEPLGFLDAYETRTGFLVHPLVALIRPGFHIEPNPGEVAECFDVPLGFLVNPENHEMHSRVWRGKTRYYYAIRYQNRYIWGATAGIIRNMYERLVLG